MSIDLPNGLRIPKRLYQLMKSVSPSKWVLFQFWKPSGSQSFHTSTARLLRRRSLARSHISDRNKQDDLKQSEPLRILYCGSDEFSVASLERLNDSREKLNIKSIDVVCKPPQPVGRGLKKLSIGHKVPIEQFAKANSLPVHQIETFTGWQPPSPEGEPINLIIAVSFGLLVPPRILNAAKYGGFNLHPSNLPDLHGPAPLHHALLRQRSNIRLTLQTLHPSRFDHGHILSRSAPLPLPLSTRRSITALLAFISPLSASFLVHHLHRRVFAPPVRSLHPIAPPLAAPKVTPADLHLDWTRMTAAEVLARAAVGTPWNELVHAGGRVRAKLHGIRTPWVGIAERRRQRRRRSGSGGGGSSGGSSSVGGSSVGDAGPSIAAQAPGSAVTLHPTPHAETLGIRTADGTALEIGEMTVAGMRRDKPLAALRKLKVDRLEDVTFV